MVGDSGFRGFRVGGSWLAAWSFAWTGPAVAADDSLGPGSLAWLGLLLLAAAAIGFLWWDRDRSRRDWVAERRSLEAERSALIARAASLPLGLIEGRVQGPLSLDARARELLPTDATSIGLADLAGLLAIEGDPGLANCLSTLAGEGEGIDAIGRAGSRVLRLRGGNRGGLVRLWLDEVGALAEAEAKSRQAMQSLAQLLDLLPYPIWRRGPDLRVTYCNTPYYRMLDLPVAEKRAPPRDLNAAAKALAARARKLGLAQSESQQLVIGGQRRLYDLTEMPVVGDGSIGFALDQTALEETQAEFSRHLSAHDDVLQSLGTGIVIFGPDRRLKFHNAAYREQFRLDTQFLSGHPTLEEVLESLRERRQIAEQADFRSFKAEFSRHVMSALAPIEELLHTPDGRTFRMVATPHPLGGVILTYEDVTDRLALEANYNTLIEVQRESINQLHEGIAVFGGDGRLKLFNPAFARMWNINPDSLAGQPHVSRVVDLVAGFFRARRDWAGLRERIVNEVTSRESRNLRIERGDKRIVDVAAIPLPDGGRLFKYTDVTDSINMERALRERNEALMAADRLKSEFIANVSYEFRTPLNAIIGYAELLSRQYFGQLNQKQMEYSASILDAAHSLLALISDVIDVAAIEAGYMSLDRYPVKVKVLLDSIFRLFQQRARSRELEFRVACAPDCGDILGDEQRLKQALSNLVSNAISAAPIGGVVAIGAGNEGGAIVVEVAMRGTQDPRGTGPLGSIGRDVTGGLGLALVKTLVESHGGTVESRTEATTRLVRCRLPAVA